MSVLDRPWEGGGARRDEVVEVFTVVLGRVGCKGLIGGPFRQLTVSLSKDYSRGALIDGENKHDVGVGVERAKCRFFWIWRGQLLREGGRKFRIGDVGQDVGNATFNGMG